MYPKSFRISRSMVSANQRQPPLKRVLSTLPYKWLALTTTLGATCSGSFNATLKRWEVSDCTWLLLKTIYKGTELLKRLIDVYECMPTQPTEVWNQGGFLFRSEQASGLGGDWTPVREYRRPWRRRTTVGVPLLSVKKFLLKCKYCVFTARAVH